MSNRTDDRTDPRKTRRLINSLTRTDGGWDKLWALFNAARKGAAADWVAKYLLAAEIDQRREHLAEGLDQYADRYEDDKPHPLDLEEVTAEVKGHAPNFYIIHRGDIWGEGDTVAEALASYNHNVAHAGGTTPEHVEATGALDTRVPHQPGALFDSRDVEGLLLVRASRDVTRETIQHPHRWRLRASNTKDKTEVELVPDLTTETGREAAAAEADA